MNVPYLTQQQVAAQPAPNGYAQVDVTPLSQGAGVGQGLQSLGYDVADVAAKAKAQANQITEFNATADINEHADALKQGLRSVEGPALMQAYEKLLPEYDQAVSDRLADLPPDVRVRVEQQARLTRDALAYDAADYTGPKFQEMAVAANQRVLGGYAKSVTLAVENGAVRYSQAPTTEAPGDSPSVRAQFILDERGIEPQFAAAHATNVQFAAVNADHLTTDQETYVRIADQLWREDAHKAVIDGLLTRGDDRAAKAYFEKHKDEFNVDDINALQAATDKASVIGDSQRAAGSAWAGAHGDTISAREGDAKSALPEGLSDEARAGAVKLIDQAADASRAQQAKQASDVFDAFDEGLQTGINASEMQKTTEFQWLQQHDPAKARGLIAIGNDVASGGLATTDDATYADVQAQINDAEPAAVGKIDPRVYVGSGLSSADAAQFQKKIDAKAKLGVGTLSPDEIVSHGVTALYNEKTVSDATERAKKVGAFQRAADDAIRQAQSQQKDAVSAEQVEKIVDELSTATLMDAGSFSDTWGAAVDLSTEFGGLIPAYELVGLVDQLQRHGEPVTRDAILAQWQRTLATRQWLPADVGD